LATDTYHAAATKSKEAAAPQGVPDCEPAGKESGPIDKPVAARLIKA